MNVLEEKLRLVFFSRNGNFFLTLLLVVFFVPAKAQDSLDYEMQDTTAYAYDYDDDIEDNILENVQHDTVKISPRDLDASRLDELRKDSDFDYAQAPTVGENLWDRFWEWVAQFINDLFRGAVYTGLGRILVWVGCIIAIVLIAFALLKVDAFRVLFKGADAPTVKGVFHENIHEMDFESLIKEATEKNDFRNAVRLIFLYSLKLLSDGQHINWQPGKTNHDYLAEIKTDTLKPGLNELSYYFDYAWYGGFPISTSQFNKVNSIFSNWRHSIQ